MASNSLYLDNWLKSLVSEADPDEIKDLLDSQKFSEDIFDFLDEASYRMHVHSDLLKKEYFDFTNDQNLQIGRVTTSFLLVESYLKKYIHSQYVYFPSEFLSRMQFNQKMKILEEFQTKDFINYFKRIAEIRNRIVHAIYEKQEINSSEVDSLFSLYVKAFGQKEIYFLKDHLNNPLDLFVKLSEFAAAELLMRTMKNVVGMSVLNTVVNTMVKDEQNSSTVLDRVSRRDQDYATFAGYVKSNKAFMNILESHDESYTNEFVNLPPPSK
ncbi:hypothetical protein CIK05_11075 [Bdellovibrio sp. qaytius]|nr:hypothetical protein CIK05_11075 [Bdellovibrio sp. qaytius]